MPSPLNILCAYPYFTTAVHELLRRTPHEKYRLIVDSGAFTAFNSGKDVTVDDYCRFLDSIADLAPFQAVQLDVIKDPEASWRNFEIMRARGYNVKPVFQRGGTQAELEQMYALSDLVFFGGVAFGGWANASYMKWVAQQTQGRKAHWLGFMQTEFIKAYRPTSVDSSSWLAVLRFGNVAFYSGAGELETAPRALFSERPLPTDYYLKAAASGFSAFEVNQLAQPRAWQGKANNLAWRLSTCGHIRRAADVEKNLGTHLYQAAAADIDVACLFECYDRLIEKGLI